MTAGVPRSPVDRGYLVGLAGVLGLEAAGVTYQLVTGVPVPAITFVATAFAVACMLRIHGPWGTMVFLALVLVIPFGSEFFGVLTGLPYGPYAYTGMSGPWLFGLVPVVIFVAWINIAYLSIATTTMAAGRSRLWLAPLDGLVAAAWDVMVDPLAVRAGYWEWHPAGPFYGVPVSNFLGWFVVVALLSLVARAVWANDVQAPARTSRTLGRILPALLLGSAACFATLCLASGFPVAAGIGGAVVTPVVVAAWARVIRSPREEPIPNPWSRNRPSLRQTSEGDKA